MAQNYVLNTYLSSLYGIEPLTVKQEHELANKIQAGDDLALEKLIKHNLRFVVYVVRGLSAWNHSKMPVEDIISIGNEYLILSAKKWKPKNNSRFATYAKQFIERGVKRELNNTENMIRLPVNIMLDIKKLKYTERNLAQILGRQPKKSELAQIMGVSERKIEELQNHILREPTCLNDLQQDDHNEETYDQ
jgi:RNA polymerase primary sigma factor